MIQTTTAMDAATYLFTWVLCFSIGFDLSYGRSIDSFAYPIILVPGLGDSQFEAKLDKPSVVDTTCPQKTNGWSSLWLNIRELYTKPICFSDNMRLVYDREAHTTSNSPGVQTKQPGFGDTETVEWTTASRVPGTDYFHNLVQDLEDNLGYVRGVSIRGAPYDFRKAPNEMKKYMKALKKLVVNTYKLNQGRKVVLLGHSMGCLYSLYFLNQRSQVWKDKYIQSLIALAGPWGGAVKIVKLMASGDDFGVPGVNPLDLRPAERSMPSMAWLMPYDTIWDKSEVLVHTPNRNYTVEDYEDFFKDIDFNDGFLMRQDTENLIKSLEAPNVEVYCLHGNEVDTAASLTYSDSQWLEPPSKIEMEDGDGTVNIQSLRGCQKWSDEPDFHHKEFIGAEHTAMVKDKDSEAYAYLLNILGSK